MLPLLALAVGGALWLLFLGGGGSTPTPTAGPLDPLGGPATDSEGPLTGADSSAGSLTGDREALDEARRRHAAQGTRLELVEGVVVDAGGNPVSAATVTLHERPRVTAWRRRGHPVGRSLLETRSDEAGRFTLRPLPRGDAFTLRAEAAGHATTLVDVPAPGAWVEMRMAPAGSLRLHIVGGSNQPVAEARAVYTTPEGSYDATSDATGFALLAGLPSGVGQLRVTHPGHRVHADPMVGVVAGEAILGANLFRDLFAGIRDIVGGRSGAYEKELRKAREIAFKELADAADTLGANAIVGIDLDYEVVGEKGGMLMVSVSGTAVTVG